MYTARVGDIFIELDDNTPQNKWKILKDGEIKSIHKYEDGNYKVGYTMKYDMESINRFLETGDFIMCKESKINALLAKIDEQEGD